MQKRMLNWRTGVGRGAVVVAMTAALLAGPMGAMPAAHAASGTAGILAGEVVSSASGVAITRPTTVTVEPGGLSFRTNANGTFSLMLDAGTYQVTAAAPTFQWTGSDPVQVTVSAGQVSTVRPVVTPSPTARAELRGKVFDEQLRPLHARVTLFDLDGNPVTGDTTSASTGDYKISGGGHIVPATYTVRVEAIDLTTCNISETVITFYPAEKVRHNAQLVCGPPPQLAPADWSNTGDMVAARFNHHASLLPDGRVLVVGGSPEPVRPLDTEIFDPATGAWTWAGGMITPRTQAKIVTLPDDRVLAMGGRDAAGNGVLTVEVFNPATEQWGVVGNIPRPTFGGAVALADGRVLAVWGESVGDLCAADSHTAIFDPADGSWTELADDDDRFPFQLTLLSDGRVLDTGGVRPTIVGGTTGCQNNLTADARLFDPATGQWTDTTEMPDLGNSSTTLLADGTVLVIANAFSFGTTVAAPGKAKTYDPATETWTQTDPMNRFRGAHTATRLNDGRVLVTGGGNGAFGGLASAEIYNPGTRTWTAIEGMNNDRGDHTATLLNDGRVLIAGVNWQGATLATLTPSAEIFTP